MLTYLLQYWLWENHLSDNRPFTSLWYIFHLDICIMNGEYCHDFKAAWSIKNKITHLICSVIDSTWLWQWDVYDMIMWASYSYVMNYSKPKRKIASMLLCLLLRPVFSQLGLLPLPIQYCMTLAGVQGKSRAMTYLCPCPAWFNRLLSIMPCYTGQGFSITGPC